MSKKEQLQVYLQELKRSGNLDGLSKSGLSNADRELLTKILEDGLVEESLAMLEELDVEGDWETIHRRLNAEKTRVLPMRSLWKYAAIFIGLISLGIALNQSLAPGEHPIPEDMITLEIGNDVKPIIGDEKQAIVLPSGQVVAVKEGNTLKYDPGYTEEPLFNELHIPHGKMFTLVLSDGTQVELNSGTHIRYPVKFSKEGAREISMSGEAYFKVSKDQKRPFIVKSGGMAIEVLGTEFNVSAYEEEHTISTVLVEGSVSLSQVSDSKNKLLLKPGHKGSWNRSEHTLSLDRVDDTQLYTSWLQGEIVFRDTPFSELLIKLERFYNVEIVNHNKELEGVAFDARYNRKVESIEEVMTALQIIVPFEYTVKTKTGGNIKEINIE